MQNSFSLSRLGLLLKKQWYDHTRLYLLSIMAMLGLFVLSFVLWVMAHDRGDQFSESPTDAIYFCFLFLFGTIFASHTFSILGDKAKATYWLTVPATHLEKLLCGLFYTCIVFPVVYFISFWLIKNATFFLIELNPKNTIAKVNPADGFEREVRPVLYYIFFSLQALFILGSVYFEKFAFIKTILVGVVLFFIYAMIFLVIFRWFFGGYNMSMRGATGFEMYGSEETKIYRLSPWVNTGIEALLKYIWAPVLLVAAYFRLKEKEL